MSLDHRVFSRHHLIVIVILYALSGAIVWFFVGPWEAIRRSFMNGLLALAWLTTSARVLRNVPIPQAKAPVRPAIELAVVTAALIVMTALATVSYLGLADLPRAIYYLVSIGTVLVVCLVSGYSLSDLGLRIGPARAWLALAIVISLNIVFAIGFQFVPAGEGITPPGSDLASELRGPLAVLMLLGGLVVRAALPEELVLRVGMQPRLAAFFGIGWAIVLQAILFSAGHLPQQLAGYGRPLLLSMAYVLPIENGLIAGYLWYRSKSLPLLLVLHVLAFIRFGI
jgi:membrane protease YdiL (CAAX protease family)